MACIQRGWHWKWERLVFKHPPQEKGLELQSEQVGGAGLGAPTNLPAESASAVKIHPAIASRCKCHGSHSHRLNNNNKAPDGVIPITHICPVLKCLQIAGCSPIATTGSSEMNYKVTHQAGMWSSCQIHHQHRQALDSAKGGK